MGRAERKRSETHPLWGPAKTMGFATLRSALPILQQYRTKVFGQTLAIFSSAEGFPENAQLAVRKQIVRLSSGTDPKIEFNDLSYGSYAVAVFHDEADAQANEAIGHQSSFHQFDKGADSAGPKQEPIAAGMHFLRVSRSFEGT